MFSINGIQVVGVFVLIAFCCSVIPAPAIHAAMLDTGVVIGEDTQHIRDRLDNLLAREEVRRALEARGVSMSEAQARVNALTDEQLHRIAGQLDSLPSGQGVSSVVGAAVFIFLVLLITDILGLTNVFPFVVDRR